MWEGVRRIYRKEKNEDGRNEYRKERQKDGRVEGWRKKGKEKLKKENMKV